MLYDSGLLLDLEAYAWLNNRRPGDQCVYPLRVHLLKPSPYSLIEEYNNSMSSVGGSVEWLFADIVDHFLNKSQDRDDPIKKMYIVRFCKML